VLFSLDILAEGAPYHIHACSKKTPHSFIGERRVLPILLDLRVDEVMRELENATREVGIPSVGSYSY
jgi:hypothetical protein